MQEKLTGELNDILENMKPDQLNRYLKENRKYMADREKAFYYYFTDVLAEKNIKLKDVYITVGVTEAMGSKIVRMEKHTKDRDMILRLCLAGRFSWDEMNRALRLYGFNELYAKDPRDACIIVAVNNQMYDLGDLDDILIAHNLKKITKEE